MPNQDIIVGIVGLIIGSLILMYHKTFANHIIESQSRFWGFKFGAFNIKAAHVVTVIGGIGFIVIGILSILHILLT